MKKIFSTMALVAAVSLVGAGTASALTITVEGDTIDVGNLDSLIAWDYVHPPSDANEIDWINQELGDNFVSEESFEKIEDMNWYQVDGFSTYYAHALTFEASHYLIKTGNPYEQYSFLFENNPLFSWAVIDLSAMSTALNFDPEVINIGALSHIAQVNTQDTPPVTPVPEPGTMLLFGAGLAGLAGLGLRRRKD